MKKLIAMFLVVVMMFSMTTIVYAKDADTQGQTTSSYMDYLEEKAENGNFFIRFIVKLVIVGVKLGWIKAEDLKGWFENDEPQNDDSPGDVTVPPLVDEEQEGIVELKLHHSQSLPYTSNGITITNVKVLREDDGYYKDDYYFMYRYSIIYEADGKPNAESTLSIGLENSTYSSIYAIVNFDENGKYSDTRYHYTNVKGDVFCISKVGYGVD